MLHEIAAIMNPRKHVCLRQELHLAEFLVHVFVGPQLQSFDNVRLVHAVCYDDNGDPAKKANLS